MSASNSTQHTPKQNPAKQNAAKRSARERLAAERAQQAKRRRRNRVITVAVAVLVVGGGIGAAVGLGGSGGKKAADGPLVVPAHTGGAGGTVITYGNANAPHTLDVWEDFRCPVCDELEKTDGTTIQKLADDGTYKIQYHMATFLDAANGGTGSMDALAAAGAALNESPQKFKEFHDVLYANQPDEKTDGFGNVNTLLDLASKVPGLKTPAFTKAVQDGTYMPWAKTVSKAFDSSGVTGTPTLKLDGKQINVFGDTGPITPAQYTALIQQTVAAAKK